MKSFAWLLLLILVLGTGLQIFLPWWVITPLCLVLAFTWPVRGGRAFLAGFLGIGLGWLVLASWLNVRNEGLLAHRVAQLLPLGGHGWLLVLLTALVGGLVGGLAALAGAWGRVAVSPAKAEATA
ncbi:hypothetical protein [Hymenobacter psychrotolerans]|uniref:Apolipoprotein N-acyltransferase n=1 Tax=Hymenobacter psychrotolerans DSM 18569 TaxID=1121959 RepID=A0A1M6PGV4_9BACT|nr:hypothetical protein [Hymenobacter psychrotolerans]SHK07185.1 hypothetical protein SAMN02746009_00236 [Hymenobacter psychrotolerans DSM 18569]